MEWLIIMFIVAILLISVAGPIAMVVGIGLILVRGTRNDGGGNAAWRETEQELGLHFEPRSLMSEESMKGELEGVGVHIKVNNRSGNRHVFSTIFSSQLDGPWGYGHRLVKRGIFDGINDLLGADEVEVADSSFNEVYRLIGQTTPELEEFLNQDRVTDCFLWLAKKYRKVGISNKTLKLEVPVRIRDKEELIDHIWTLVDAVTELETIAREASSGGTRSRHVDDAESGSDDGGALDGVDDADSDGGYSNVAW